MKNYSRNEYERARWKNDDSFRVEKYNRKRIRKILVHSTSSSNRRISLLGCGRITARKAIESKFYPHPKTGEMMTWDNYGQHGWHLDHVIPLSKFNLLNKRQLRKAFNYKNLQPLWAVDNYKKRDKIITFTRK